MRYFLTIREGDAPGDSYPILASADQEIVEAVVKMLARKLVGTPGNISVLKKHARRTEGTQGDGNKDGEPTV